MHAEAIFTLLFVVATTVAIAARWLRMPYTVALVLAGLLLGALDLLAPPHLTKDLLFSVFLPGLIFEAAYHLEFTEFWRNRLPIVSLAVPGVIAAILLTAVVLVPLSEVLGFAHDLSWQDGLVFGALIAATDPIAVVALFKSLGVPKRLSVLIEGESLLNDGTAVVFFTLILGIVGGASVSGAGLLLEFLATIGAGALIGTTIGLVISHVIQRVDDPMIEITLTTIAAYGSFVTAEQFHYSGVIATVVAGMLCGNYAARTGMSPTTRVAVETFWEYIAFALNSIVFLLIGFEVRFDTLLANWELVLAAYLAVSLGRAVVVFTAAGVLRRAATRLPRGWSVVLTWGGLRGGISMVLVLGLPETFPHRELLIAMTFGVVLLSILLNGLSMAPLLRRLGVVSAHELRTAYEVSRGEMQAANAALVELREMERRGLAAAEVLAALRGEYEKRIGAAENEIRALHLERTELRDEELQRARRHLILVEKAQVVEAFHRGVLSQDAHEELLTDIDARLFHLDEGGAGTSEPADES